MKCWQKYDHARCSQRKTDARRIRVGDRYVARIPWEDRKKVARRLLARDRQAHRRNFVWAATSSFRHTDPFIFRYQVKNTFWPPGTRIPRSLRKFYGGRARV